MARLVPIPAQVKTKQTIYKKGRLEFGIQEIVYFLISLPIAIGIFQRSDGMINGVFGGLAAVVIITGFGFSRWPTKSTVFPTGQRIDVMLYNLLHKKIVHKATYTRAVDFEYTHTSRGYESRVKERERY